MYKEHWEHSYDEVWIPNPNQVFKTKKDVSGVLSGLGVNSMTRMKVFFEIAPELHGRLYWIGLGDSYTDSDNLFSIKDDVKMAFLSKESDRNSIMNSKERLFLKQLPSILTLYRGMTEDEQVGGDYGISWSLSKDIAKFFAHTYGRNYSTRHLKKVVHEVRVNKNDVIAYFNGRNEQEIIWIPNSATNSFKMINYK